MYQFKPHNVHEVMDTDLDGGRIVVQNRADFTAKTKKGREV